jgi:hypothetical protein
MRVFGESHPLSLLVASRLPIQVEDLGDRPERVFGVAMAFHAPSHLQSLLFPGNRHLIDRTVTADATDPFSNVNAMIEIDIVG